MATLLELACQQTEAAECYEESFEEVTVSFQSNRLKSIDTSIGSGIGLRVIRNGRMGFASSTRRSDTRFLVDSALAAAQYGQVCHSPLPGPIPAGRVECFDPVVPRLATDQMAAEGEQALRSVLTEVPGFQCEAEVTRTIVTVHICNSSGLDTSYTKTLYSFGVYAFLGREGDFLGIGESLSASNYNEWADCIAERILERVRLSQTTTTIDSGVYPVVFTPRAVPVVLASLRKGINGKMVQKGISPLSSQLNQQILDPSLTIVDSGVLPYGRATTPVDGEGVPCRATTIVAEGVLRSFVLDTQTAALLGRESTANAVRDYDSLPFPGTTNLLIHPGNTTYEEMVQDMSHGVIIDQVIGAGQSNILMGEFSVNLDLGFKVEHGKLKGRLKNVMVAGNSYDLLKDVRAIGDKQHQSGATYTPHLYFGALSVAG